MTIIIQAPRPKHDVTMVLPNALRDAERKPRSKIILGRTVTGGTRTYVRSTKEEDLTISFTLTRSKSLEVVEFFKIYRNALLTITLADGTIWAGKLSSEVNPSPVGRLSLSEKEISLVLTFIAEPL